jgi:hypothetical protein
MSGSYHDDPGQAHADGYDAGYADGFNEGRREADLTGHLLRPHALHIIELLWGKACPTCTEIRAVLGDLLPTTGSPPDAGRSGEGW